MSLEDSINKLTAALEAATGALIAASAKAGATVAAAPAPATQTPPKRGPGRPKAETAAPADAGDGGLGADDGGLDGGLGEDDGGLGGGEPAVTPEDAKTAVLAYRDKAIKLKGKDAGLGETRALMNKFVKSLDDIKDDNAAAVKKAFDDAVAKLK